MMISRKKEGELRPRPGVSELSRVVAVVLLGYLLLAVGCRPYPPRPAGGSYDSSYNGLALQATASAVETAVPGERLVFTGTPEQRRRLESLAPGVGRFVLRDASGSQLSDCTFWQGAPDVEVTAGHCVKLPVPTNVKQATLRVPATGREWTCLVDHINEHPERDEAVVFLRSGCSGRLGLTSLPWVDNQVPTLGSDGEVLLELGIPDGVQPIPVKTVSDLRMHGVALRFSGKSPDNYIDSYSGSLVHSTYRFAAEGADVVVSGGESGAPVADSSGRVVATMATKTDGDWFNAPSLSATINDLGSLGLVPTR